MGCRCSKFLGSVSFSSVDEQLRRYCESEAFGNPSFLCEPYVADEIVSSPFQFDLWVCRRKLGTIANRGRIRCCSAKDCDWKQSARRPNQLLHQLSKCVHVGRPQKKIQAKLASGFERTITFRTTDFYGQQLFASTSPQVQQIVATNVVAPQTVWVLPTVAGSSAATNSYSPLLCIPKSISNFQVLLNQQPQNSFPSRNLTDLYNYFCALKPTSGVADSTCSEIDFPSWLQGRFWVGMRFRVCTMTARSKIHVRSRSISTGQT